jgi:hypothetical protein
MEGDTPITLINVTNMPTEQHEALIERIRERRLKPVREYEKLTLMQEAAKRDGVEKKLNKTLEMFVKDLARVDLAMTKLEERCRKIQILRMDLEDL